ncbi:MAG: hypothetical protein HGA94_02160, partial [Candidatus Aminicenantes bacterium]|nr:hypothetical protein [Candidatus Aminicenantes bacterium]
FLDFCIFLYNLIFRATCRRLDASKGLDVHPFTVFAHVQISLDLLALSRPIQAILLEALAAAVWVKLAGTETLMELSPFGDKQKHPDLLSVGRS